LEEAVLTLIVVLLIIWLLLGVIGAVVKGLFWLVIVAAILFVVTGALGLRGNRRIGS
jgi:hypothetical protein